MTLATYSYPGISKSDAAKKGREILERKIAAGKASAVHAITQVQNAVPVDHIVPGRIVRFTPDDAGRAVNAAGLKVCWSASVGDAEMSLHRHALGQACGKAGVPAGFVADLAGSPEPWRRELAAELLTKHFSQPREGKGVDDPSKKRFLVRSIQGQVRGLLSDRYRRIDSRPTLDAFVEECQAVGAVPVEGIATDTRVSLRAVLPHVFEPADGEILALGAEWGNSDFGAAKHWFRTFILRLTCLNGATMEDVLAQVHTGTRLHENFEFSERTYQADTRASVLALRDVVRGALGPKNVESMLNVLREANEKEMDWKRAAPGLTSRLTKGEAKLVKDAFDSQDVINLPPGKTAWRMSNALSWIANGEEVDAERKQELQRLAGEVIDGRRDKPVSED